MYTDFLATERIIVVDRIPDAKTLPNGAMMGYYSVTIPQVKMKLVPYQYLKEYRGMHETETGFTRQYMRTLPKRKIRKEEYYQYRVTRPPLYVRPAIVKDAIYVDLKAAYPSIYKKLGWITDYVRMKYWGVGDPLHYPYPMTWKAGRSFIVSGARHVQYGRHIYNGRIEVKKYMSPFSNPPLVSGVYDVLSMIARFAEYSLHACYWNVDGGIMHRKAADIFLPFIESIGLQASIKYEGKAVVMSSGYWKVGAHETKNYEASKPSKISSGDYIPVTKDEAEWIYKNFRSIAERQK